MTDAVAYIDEGLSRRDLLRRGLIGAGVVAAALPLQVSVAWLGPQGANGSLWMLMPTALRTSS